MMKKQFILTLFFSTVATLRILAVWPTVTKSHYLCCRRIMLALLERGHQVVVISPFQESATNLTWIEVEVSSFFEAVPSLKDLETPNNFFAYQKYIWSIMNTYTKYILDKPKLLNFIQKDDSHFDLIFMHDFFQPVFYGFGHKYKSPVAVLSTFGIANYINDYTGNPLQVFEYSHEFFDASAPLNVWERIKNMIYTFYDVYGRRLCVLHEQNELAKEAFGSDVLNLKELETGISLVLLNSHFSMADKRAYGYNLVEIGGAHINEPKILDDDLKAFLDGASNGAILFSLGSFLDLASQPDHFIANTLEVLGSLKQRVVLKWNSKKKIEGYQNLFLSSWLPQNDVLAHPNIRLFITHGGLLSNQEAVYHAVPIICVPFQASQTKVCTKSSQLGFAIIVDRHNLTPDVLNTSIQKILSTKSYKENAVKTSNRFKDRPLSPLDTAVYWLEYCARNKEMGLEVSRSHWKCPFVDVFLGCLIMYVLSYSIKRYLQR